jgi:hypothetical protein
LIDLSEVKLSDANIKDVRIFPSSVEVDYEDWQEQCHTLLFNNVISCFVLSAHGRDLSHGEVEAGGEYLHECCEVAEAEMCEEFHVFNFIEAWNGRKILRIVAENVEEVRKEV